MLILTQMGRMMDGGGWMTGGMALLWILILTILVLIIVVLVKVIGKL